MYKQLQNYAVKCTNFLQCVRKLLFIFSFFISFSGVSQNIQILGDSVVTSDPDEWIVNELLAIKTNYNATKIIKCIVTLIDNEDSICFFTDSISISDTLLAYDTLRADFILKNISTVNENFANYYNEKHKFIGGNYTLKIKFYDSNYNFMNDSAVKFLTIVDDFHPELIAPGDCIDVFDSFLNTTIFTWSKAKKTGYTDFYYYFKLYNINDSSDILDLENCFNSHAPVYSTYIKNDTTLTLPFLQSLIDTTKFYSWSVKTYLDSNHTQTIAANEGVTPPYVLKRSSTKRAVSCTNNYFDGFESGTLNGWVCYIADRDRGGFKNRSGVYQYTVVNPTSGRHTIVGSGFFDQYSLSPNLLPWVPVNGGLYALQLGSNAANTRQDPVTPATNAQIVSRTFFVDKAHQSVVLRWAAVLSGGHSDPNEESFLQIRIYRRRIPGNIRSPIFFIDLRPNSTPLFIHGTGSVYYTPWDCERLDLSSFVGNNITIEINTSGCMLDAHFGYAYIDFCGSEDPIASLTSSSAFCVDLPVNMNGSSSSNYNQWRYSVQQSNSSWTPTGSKFHGDINYSSSIPSSYNIMTLLQSSGVKCGYFIVTLYVKNTCSDWITSVVYITINCPAAAAAGADRCNTGLAQVIGTFCGTCSLYTYSWSPTTCLTNTTSRSATFDPIGCSTAWPKTYTLTVTDNNGCISTDDVIIFNSIPVLTSINASQSGCDWTLSFTGGNYDEAIWTWYNPNTYSNTFDNRTSFVFPNYSGNVTVTLTLVNWCGSSTSLTYTVTGSSYSSTSALELQFKAVIESKDPNPNNRVLTIYQNGMANGASNAYYGATDAVLIVRDVFGKTYIVYANHSSMSNGDIKWDGKIGGYLRPGIYYWMLGLINCENRYSGLYEYTHRTYSTCTMVKSKFFPKQNICVGYTGWSGSVLNKITVR